MTVTKASLAKRLQSEIGLSHAECEEVVEEFFGEIVEMLSRGDEVKLSGFGKFTLHDKKARPGRNPRTGDEVIIAARRVVTFQAGRKLKATLEWHHTDENRAYA